MEVIEMKDHVQSLAHSENDTSLFFKKLTCRWLPNCHECVISELVYGFYVGYKRMGISPYSMSGTNSHFTEKLGGNAAFKLPFIGSYYVPGAC